MVKKVEKLLVEECEVFWKDQNEIGCIECLKLKLNFTGDTSFHKHTVKFLHKFIVS